MPYRHTVHVNHTVVISLVTLITVEHMVKKYLCHTKVEFERVFFCLIPYNELLQKHTYSSV